MKKIILFGAAALAALSLMSACSGAPEEESSVSLSSSEISSGPASGPDSYTVSEAAAINKDIPASDFDVVQFAGPGMGSETATIKTSMGDIDIILYRQYAPKAVENFVTHANEGYYTGLSLSRVLKNFIIEGGSPDATGGKSIYTDGGDAYFENEYSLSLWNFRGAIGMTNAAGHDKNGSQFYIVQAPFVDEESLSTMQAAGYPQEVLDLYEEHGGVPGFDWRRTVFGMVEPAGMDVIDAIARASVDENGNPMETILIDSIVVNAE